MNPLGVVRRRDRTLDQGNVVRTFDHGPRSLGEIRNFDLAGDTQQFIFAVEQAQLASVAGSELPNGKLGL